MDGGRLDREDAARRAEAASTTPAGAATNWANYMHASVNIAKARGLFVEKHEHSGSLHLLMQLLNAPQTVQIAETGDTSEFERA